MSDSRFSPTPMKVEKTTMDFFEALRTVKEGYSITKLEWDDPEIYGVLYDCKVMLHKKDGMLHPWIINEGDLLGIDWVRLPHP